MDRGHEARFNANAFLKKDMDQRGQTVRGAGSVRHDIVLGRVIFLFVHAHEKGLHLALGRRGN